MKNSFQSTGKYAIGDQTQMSDNPTKANQCYGLGVA